MAKKKAKKSGARKKVDARKARIRDLASRKGDVTGGGIGAFQGGFGGITKRGQ